MIDIRIEHHPGGDNSQHSWLGWPRVPGDYAGAFEGDNLVGSCRLSHDSVPAIILADLIVLYGLPESAAYDSFVADPRDPQYAVPTLTVQALVVQPEYRRRGIATDILQAVIAYAKSLRLSRVLIDVDSDNQAARRLYMKCGFESYDATWPAALRHEDMMRLVRWICPLRASPLGRAEACHEA